MSYITHQSSPCLCFSPLSSIIITHSRSSNHRIAKASLVSPSSSPAASQLHHHRHHRDHPAQTAPAVCIHVCTVGATFSGSPLLSAPLDPSSAASQARRRSKQSPTTTPTAAHTARAVMESMASRDVVAAFTASAEEGESVRCVCARASEVVSFGFGCTLRPPAPSCADERSPPPGEAAVASTRVPHTVPVHWQ